MIKKSLFEEELIHGMQRELQSHEKKQGMASLVQAAEYLHSAAEIFEEAGMTEKADQVIRILGRIVLADKKKKEEEDSSKADDNDIHHKSKHEKDFYEKMMEWIKNPATPVDPKNPQPGEEIVLTPVPPALRPGSEIKMQSLMEPKELPKGDDLVFQSIAQELGLVDDNDAKGKPRKPKNPTNVSDRHTKGLTPEKMVENLKHHGTEFNMADDQNVDVAQPKSFDDFYEKWKARHMKEEMEEAPPTVRESIRPKPDFGDLEGLIVSDDAGASDMLDADIDEKPLAVHEDSLGKTFEDSD